MFVYTFDTTQRSFCVQWIKVSFLEKFICASLVIIANVELFIISEVLRDVWVCEIFAWITLKQAVMALQISNQKLGTPISTLTGKFLLTKARNSNEFRNKLAEDVEKLLRLLFALLFHCCVDFNYHSGGKRKFWGQYQSFQFQRIFADYLEVKYANQWRPSMQTNRAFKWQSRTSN